VHSGKIREETVNQIKWISRVHLQCL